MKKSVLVALVLCTTLGLQAQWGKKIKGNGNFTTVERSVGEYDHVAMAGWFDMDIVAGKEGKITLEGESNLLEYIKTEVKDGKLVVKVKKGVNLKPSDWNKGIQITVPVQEIGGVTMSGSGDIVGRTTLKTDDFTTTMSGSGDITLDVDADEVKATLAGSGDINLSGNTKDFTATISGSGDIKAYELKAAYVTAQVSGSADIRVYASEMLTARVSGSGDVRYKGNPTKVDSKVSGSGDVTGYR